MKHIIKGLPLLLFALIIGSCASYQEELWINKDGSGTYKLTADMSAMLEMMEGLSQISFEDTEGKDGTTPPDFWESLGGEVVNKTIRMKDSMPAEMIAELEKPELLDKMEMQVVANKEQRLFKTTLLMRYSSLDELQEIMNHAERFNQLEGTDGEPKEMFEGLAFFTARPGGHGFSLHGNKLARSATPEDEQMLDGLLEGDDTMESLEMMLEQSTMTTTIHLPGEVYQVNNQSKLGTVDGNTVVFQYELIQLVKKEVDTEFEIYFNPKP